MLVFVFAIGAGVAYAIMKQKMDRQQSAQETELLKRDMLRLKGQQNDIVSIDSLKSIVEERILTLNDSIVERYDKELIIIRNQYRYELKKRDARIEASLDSLNRLIPTLPQY